MTAPEGDTAGGLSRRHFLRGSAALGAGLTITQVSPASALRGKGRGRGRRNVAVIGGGVAGMTAAHELALRGFKVTLYELKELGGKARSIPVGGTGTGGRADLPAEHGFRAEFSFYQNLPDTMRKIPFPGNPNGVYDNMVPCPQAQLARSGAADLTLPLDLSLAPAYSLFQLQQTLQAGLELVLGIPLSEVIFFAKQVAMYFTSCEERRFGQWEYVNWWDYTRAAEMSEDYQKQFAAGLTRNLAAAKPQDMSVNSTGIVGESFAWSLLQRPDAPPGSPDRALNGPTNESWIHPWVAELQRLGVTLRVGEAVEKLHLRGGSISGFQVRGQNGQLRDEEADWVVSAVPVERAQMLFTPEVLALDPSLEGLDSLVTEWMNAVIFHLDREVPICAGHVSYVDSEFALTSISQAQLWDRDISSGYGDGRTRECFSAIISDWSTPGMLYGKPAWELNYDEICNEVWAQIKAHLNDSAVQLEDSWVTNRFVDPSITYLSAPDSRGRTTANDSPLLINTPGSWDDRPSAATAIPNLILAGDYVRNTMNVATMESACETGRRAAQAVLDASDSWAEPVEVFNRWVPPEIEPFKQFDAERYRQGLPHILDV